MKTFFKVFGLGLLATCLMIVSSNQVASAKVHPPVINYGNATATLVTIHGQYLATTKKVTFDRTRSDGSVTHVNAKKLTVVSGTEVKVVPPKLAFGYWDMTLTTAGGSIFLEQWYSAPGAHITVTKVTPTTLSTKGGQTVKIYGTHLDEVWQAWIQHLPAQPDAPVSITKQTPTELDLLTAPRAAGPAQIELNTYANQITYPVKFVKP